MRTFCIQAVWVKWARAASMGRSMGTESYSFTIMPPSTGDKRNVASFSEMFIFEDWPSPLSCPSRWWPGARAPGTAARWWSSLWWSSWPRPTRGRRTGAPPWCWPSPSPWSRWGSSAQPSRCRSSAASGPSTASPSWGWWPGKISHQR